MNQVLERKAPASRPWAVPLAGLLTPTAFFAAALLWQELWVKLFCVHALTVEGMAVTALFVLPAAFGARSTFYAEPVSDILGPLMSVAVYALTIRKILSFPPRKTEEDGKEPV